MAMQAKVGDWLIVSTRAEGRRARRGEIREVRADGRPPFRVRWLDDGHEALVFPGPDAQVLTAAEVAGLDRAAARRIDTVQTHIRRRGGA
jgi:hypothetical protein